MGSMSVGVYKGLQWRVNTGLLSVVDANRQPKEETREQLEIAR